MTTTPTPLHPVATTQAGESIRSREFYELMQTYRHMPAVKLVETVDAYEAVIAHINAHTAAQVAASKPAEPNATQLAHIHSACNTMAINGRGDTADFVRAHFGIAYDSFPMPAAASGEPVYQVRLNGVWHDVTLEAQKHYDESKRRVLFTAPALRATGEAELTKSQIEALSQIVCDPETKQAIIAAMKGA